MDRLAIFLLFAAAVVVGSVTVSAQSVKQTVNTTASLRGLSVVNKNVVWASGTGGTVVRTIDGGRHWEVITVPGAEKLDFRDIESFDANTAYILSIGSGEISRIYKTIDGGKTWAEQFRNSNEKAFFDAIACWDRNNCIAMSDPVDHRFVMIETSSGGSKWASIETAKMLAAVEGEAAFAASGTCLIAHGKSDAFLVTGGNAARVFKSVDRGRTWKVVDTPLVRGTAGSGIFSIAMFDSKTGLIVGGNFEKPETKNENLAVTNDGASTFRLGKGLSGYRSGVAFVSRNVIVAVGSTGSDITFDGGRTWRRMDEENYNSVGSKGETWAVGAKGLVARIRTSN